VARNVISQAVAWACVINGLWNTYCVHVSIKRLQAMLAQRRRRARVGSDADDRPTIVVVVPMLHEADRADQVAAHWHKFLSKHEDLRLCVVTTERERIEAPSCWHTWDVLGAHDGMRALVLSGRAEVLHYPAANRTYGEQLRWALDDLTLRTKPGPTDYFYVTNADARLSDEACLEIIELASAGVLCAQQPSVFFANLKDVSWLAAGEALYQSRWTFECEIFRYLVGSGQLGWMPRWLRSRWYQHAVGHGLLLSQRYYLDLGGLPCPKYGLEDAALGFAIRSQGGYIQPFATLECSDAPASFRELQRQRLTWIRGPLCSAEYLSHSGDAFLALQGTYNGVKWALGLPVLGAILYLLPLQDRILAVAGLLLGLYGPILRLMGGLHSLEFINNCRPQQGDLLRGLTAYPFAAINCWLGGLRGLGRVLTNLAKQSPPVQQQTRETV
jgi:hypothetical protein